MESRDSGREGSHCTERSTAAETASEMSLEDGVNLETLSRNLQSVTEIFFHFFVTALASLLSIFMKQRSPLTSVFPILEPRFEDVTSILSDQNFEKAF